MISNKTDMKIFKKSIIILSLITTFSCSEYLEVVPDNVATFDIAFNSRYNAEGFLFTIYSYCPSQANLGSNPAWRGSGEAWSNPYQAENQFPLVKGQQNVSNPKYNEWDGDLFVALRDANIFLENIDKVPDLDNLEKLRWVAEVKFLKAYYQFWLLRMYGPIPIIRENIEVGASVDEVKISRSSVDDVFAYIDELLLEAIVDLPEQMFNPIEEYGRISKPIALAIRAKILTTAASPLFNGNSLYVNFVDENQEPYFNQVIDPTKWEKAKLACSEAIALCDTYHSLYEPINRGFVALSDSTLNKLSIREAVTEELNSEVIWANTNQSGHTLQNESMPIMDETVGASVAESVQRSFSPTLASVEMFLSNNGLPINEDKTYDYSNRFDLVENSPEDHSYYIKKGYPTVKMHLNREPRFYGSLAFDGSIWYGHGIDSDDPAGSWYVQCKSGQVGSKVNHWQYSGTGYWAKKLVHPKTVVKGSFSARRYYWPVMRLTDLYLLYAECCNETDNREEAIKYVDKIRMKYNLPDIVNAYTQFSNDPNKPASQNGLREIIQRERAVELMYERQLYWDWRRWLKIDAMLNQNIVGWNIDSKTAEEYYIPIDLYAPTFSLKDYLWPIKEQTMLKNSNLVQNPGW